MWLTCPQLQLRFLLCGAPEHYVRHDVEKNTSLQVYDTLPCV